MRTIKGVLVGIALASAVSLVAEQVKVIPASGVNGGGGIFTNLLFSPDNTYDIGASGATRPRTLYLGSHFHIGSNGTRISEGGADGVLLLRNNAGSDFSRLQFGGTTSSFPALKRSGTQIDVRLADDSAYASLAGANVVANGSLFVLDGVTAPSALNGYAKIYVDAADGDLKVIFGDGTVKTLATDTP